MTSRDRLIERIRAGRISLIFASDVALLFGVSRKSIARWADDGKLPHLRTPGGHRRYPARAILDLVERGSEASA